MSLLLVVTGKQKEEWNPVCGSLATNEKSDLSPCSPKLKMFMLQLLCGQSEFYECEDLLPGGNSRNILCFLGGLGVRVCQILLHKTRLEKVKFHSGSNVLTMSHLHSSALKVNSRKSIISKHSNPPTPPPFFFFFWRLFVSLQGWC